MLLAYLQRLQRASSAPSEPWKPWGRGARYVTCFEQGTSAVRQAHSVLQGLQRPSDAFLASAVYQLNPWERYNTLKCAADAALQRVHRVGSRCAGLLAGLDWATVDAGAH